MNEMKWNEYAYLLLLGGVLALFNRFLSLSLVSVSEVVNWTIRIIAMVMLLVGAIVAYRSASARATNEHKEFV